MINRFKISNKLYFKYYSIFSVLVITILLACGNTDSEKSNEEANQEDISSKYTLTPFTTSKQFADASIASMNYDKGTFSFGVEGESYELGVQTEDAPQKMCANSAKGQHIHLIVDDQPYAAKYVSNFEHEVADGSHYLLAFLSRSYHESIKTQAAHVARKVMVKDGTIENGESITSPMLFYSRPKGTYVGKSNTDKVMLDFYLTNIELGGKYKVLADINGEEHTLETWQPYYIEGLPVGENTIKLSLIDGAGKLVDAPLNPVSRTFTLQADPAE